jgi:hypothetical protein
MRSRTPSARWLPPPLSEGAWRRHPRRSTCGIRWAPPATQPPLLWPSMLSCAAAVSTGICGHATRDLERRVAWGRSGASCSAARARRRRWQLGGVVRKPRKRSVCRSRCAASASPRVGSWWRRACVSRALAPPPPNDTTPTQLTARIAVWPTAFAQAADQTSGCMWSACGSGNGRWYLTSRRTPSTTPRSTLSATCAWSHSPAWASPLLATSRFWPTPAQSSRR